MKKFYLSALAVLALASCSKSELATRPDDGRVEIKMSTQILDIATRAPFTSAFIDASHPLPSYVLGSKDAADFTDPYCSGTVTFKGGGLKGFDVPQYYPNDNSLIYLTGLYPATGWTNVGTTATNTFDGKTDIMATVPVSSQKSTAVDTWPEIRFNHLLTKLSLSFRANNEAAITAWGDVVGVKVLQADGHEVNTKVTVTLADGTAEPGTAFTEAAVGGIPFYAMDNSTIPGKYTDDLISEDKPITLTTASYPKATAYVMVEPIMADADARHYQLEITTKKSGEEAVVNTVDIDLFRIENYMSVPITGNTSGNGYDIMVTFKASEIEIQPNVTPWGDSAGSGEAEL